MIFRGLNVIFLMILFVVMIVVRGGKMSSNDNAPMLLYKVRFVNIETAQSKAMCVLYLTSEFIERKVYVSLSNIYKLLNVFNTDKLGNIVNKDIRCRINKQNKITSISRLYLDEEEWIVCREIDFNG